MSGDCSLFAMCKFLIVAASLVAVSAVVMRLLPQDIWNLPGPGIEPVSPALAGGFLTTEMPGQS